MLTAILEVDDPAMARALIVALKSYGFHPMEMGGDALSGLTDPLGFGGQSIRVPEDEAADARILAEALYAQMRK
ncbi:MAG: hypothetical protein GXP01_05300 [Alphaproteobacteria bacterium]|nr:hypothetical protein [Alphaproteobacteria bacterium]